MFFAPTRTVSNDQIQHIGQREYLHCDCRSVFRILRVQGRRFIELTRHHRCTHCRTLITEYANHNSVALLVEV